MSDWQMFKRSLANHPGHGVVIVLMATAAIAGLMAKDHQTERALLGAGIFSLFWITVIWTAWTLRKQYDDNKEGRSNG